jgi:uncharacterized membrane protein
MASDTRLFRYLALVSHTLLIIWLTLWQFTFTKVHTYSPTFIVLIYLLPLLLPYRGVLKGKPYTHAWANFVVLFYLIHACTVVYAVPAERWYGVVELVLCTTMFVGCAAFARKRGRELGLGIKKLKEEMQEEKEYFEQQK